VKAPAPPSPTADPRKGTGRQDWQTWPRYEAAVLGFRNYWYPVEWSRNVRSRLVPTMVLGERLALVREDGTMRAIRVGVPDPAASTDTVAYAIYPLRECLGIVWVYVGDGDPPPVSTDIPSELLADDAVVVGRMSRRHGNWRFGAENGFDEGHAKWLHRRSLWTLRRQMPTWVRHHIEPTGEGWITRVPDEVHYETHFPDLGVWPRHRFWRSRGRGKATVSIRLPCLLRVAYAPWQHYEWWVPIDEAHHIYLQLVSKRAGRLERIRFYLYYKLWVRWVFHGLFNDEDALMVDVMDAPPERLYRPDVALTEWRKLCESQTRGLPQPMATDGAKSADSSNRPTPPGVRRTGMPLTHRLRELIRQ
jgi:phenylpropionate dioxygenase-like ring-hydroxylating dioxygenase large terminal subunit